MRLRAVGLALALAACGSDVGEPDPRDCSCADEVMPDGFYAASGEIRLPIIAQVVRELADGGEKVRFGFSYRFGMGNFSASPLSGTFDGCLFSGTEVFDVSVTEYEGVWSCEARRLEGFAESPLEGSGTFAFEPIDAPPFLADAAFRIYGSVTHELPDNRGDAPYYVPADFGRLDQTEWTLIGEATETATFETDTAFPVLMITWPPAFRPAIDALVDEVSGETLSDAFGTPDVGFAAFATDDPLDLAGPADGVGFRGEPDYAGFVAVTFPQRGGALAIDPQSDTARIRVELTP